MRQSRFFTMSKICFICDLPATLICKCKENPTYICDEHAFEHLDKEGSHPVELLHSDLSLGSDSLEDQRNLELDGYRIRGHTRPIASISVLDDCVVTGEGDGLYRWSLQDKLLINRYETQCIVWAVSVNKMKNIIAAGLDDHTIILIDSFLGNVLHKISEHQGAVLCLRFANNQNYLLSGCESGHALISNIPKIIKGSNDAFFKANWPNDDLFDKELFLINKSSELKAILCITTSWKDEYIITANLDKKIEIFSFELFQVLITISCQNFVLAIECARNDLLVYGGIEFLKVYDLNEMKKKEKFEVKGQIIYSILIPQSSEYILIANNKNQIKKLSIGRGQRTTTVSKTKKYYIKNLAFSQNENKIFAILGGWTVGIFSNKLQYEGIIGNDRFICAKASSNLKNIFMFYVNGGIQDHIIESKQLEKSYSSRKEIDQFWKSYHKKENCQFE